MVFVVDKHKKPLMPCSEKRARKMLEKKRAVVHKMYPFTIRLKDRTQEESKLQPLQMKIDPGAKTTGLALLRENDAVMLGELEHKTTIKDKLEKRRSLRKKRRNRKTRYRQKRFDNRKREKGWLAPSLKARVEQTAHLVDKFKKLVPLAGISVEHVKFDTQLMQNPEVKGVEYQQGELKGYEVREYLLEKFGRKCAYCGKENVPLEIEHIVPRSRGGSNRVDNLTIACHECNQKKGNKTAKEFGYPNIQKQVKQSLKAASYVNSTRWKLYEILKLNGVPVECGSGALTKMNRIRHKLPKEHYFDAVCVGWSTPENINIKTKYIQQFKYMGRGKRQMCQPNKYGFPKNHRKRKKNYFGYFTGDIVRAYKPKGKNAGKLVGRVTIKAKAHGFKVDGKQCHVKYIKRLYQRNDGWQYKLTYKLV